MHEVGALVVVGHERGVLQGQFWAVFAVRSAQVGDPKNPPKRVGNPPFDPPRNSFWGPKSGFHKERGNSGPLSSLRANTRYFHCLCSFLAVLGLVEARDVFPIVIEPNINCLSACYPTDLWQCAYLLHRPNHSVWNCLLLCRPITLPACGTQFQAEEAKARA